VLLGVVEGCPFYIGGAQFKTWEHTQLIRCHPRFGR
jgi:uncharacterized protein (DUF779 family)